MGPRILHTQIAAAFTLLVLLLAAAPASADLFFGSPGSGAGQTSSPAGVAVDTSVGEPTSGRVYVADRGNQRISVFDSSGAFLFAFGWKVNATAPEEKLQTCTTASGCQPASGGSGSGQFLSPEKIAVDPVTHAVYVGETGNRRVQKFDANGNFLFMLGGEVNKTAVEEGRIAEQNICPAPGHPGDVCQAGKVGDGEGQFLNTKLPVAVGPGGTLYVADAMSLGGNGFNNRIQKFTPSGTYVGPELNLPDTVSNLQDVAVDSSGDIYVANHGVSSLAIIGGVRRYHADGSPYGAPYPITPKNPYALALDASGNLFVTGGETVSGFSAGTGGVVGVGVIAEYDSAGTQLRSFYGSGPMKGVGGPGLAIYHTAAGDLLVSQSGTPADGIQHIPFPPPGPLTLSNFTEASEIGNSKATLRAAINPEGKATEYAFQYVDDATFQADQPNGFENAEQTPFEAIPGPGGSSFELQTVTKKLPVETLVPETKYHVRAIARNADAPAGNPGTEATFTTLGPPEVLDTWATGIGSDTARLHGEADPLLLATTGYFQYVDEATYEADVEALGPGHGFDHAASTPDVGGGSASLDFGSGEGGTERSAQAYPLEPGTTYRYRLVLEGVFDPILGPERTLRTFALGGANETGCPNQDFRIGTSAALPDCRAYEMVSPLDKNNGDVISLPNFTGYPTNLEQSSTDGSGFTYSSYRAFANPQSAPFTNQYLALRDPGAGWLTEAIDPPRGRSFGSPLENEYKAFSPDLSQGWMRQEGEPTLDSCAPAGHMGLYRRDSKSGAYHALSCAQPNILTAFRPELQGFSADGSEAVFRVNDALAVSAGPQPSGATVDSGGGAFRPIYQTYLSSGAGELRLVSVLPNGEASEKDSGAGMTLVDTSHGLSNQNRFSGLDNAVSDDGTRVFWTAGTNFGQIYLRLNATSEQSASGACDEAGKACTIAVSGSVSPASASFQKANPEGSKVLFTVQAGPLQGNLYAFDVAAEEPQLIAEGTVGSILGASEDLARVYFVSTKASAQAQGEGALEGKPNVYLYDEGTTRFIGTLSSPGPGNPYPDLLNPYGSVTAAEPIGHTARVGPDGGSVAFMSNSRELSEASAAGYDNTDAASGQPNLEVYLYDAMAEEGAGALHCVSCNPGGERPRGREVVKGSNGKVGPYAAATIPVFQTQFQQPRYLSDDGERVFFNSFEALVIGDTNGKQDVYQWEAPGSGRCTAQSASYIPTSEGCLSLISSGQSPEDSKFLDASASGSDVFFTTAEGLLPQDYGLVDVYDARVDGGFAPPPSPPPACEGDACQSPVIPPNDPTPASASFDGAGNPIAKGRRSSRCPAGKRQVRKAGKSRCVKRQRAKAKRQRAKANQRKQTQSKGRAGR